MKRTQEEIVARIESVKADDWMGFRCEVLFAMLDFAHARPYLREDVTAEQWAEDMVNPDDLETRARDYYEFALTKIDGHRGISANRFVDKLTEYAWLLGRHDAITAMDAEGFAQYGAPKVRAFGEAFGLSWPEDRRMVRMAEGLPCTDDCCEGCGR